MFNRDGACSASFLANTALLLAMLAGGAGCGKAGGTASVTFNILSDESAAAPAPSASSGARLGQIRQALNGTFSFADVARIRITVTDSATGNPIYVNFDLSQSVGGWTGTLPFLPRGQALTFFAHAFDSSANELFNGSTDQTLTADSQTVTLLLAPATNGQIITLPRIARITLPSQFVSGRPDTVSFALEANANQRLTYTVVPASGGGGFLPASGAVTLLATAGTVISQYLPPPVTAPVDFTHTVTVTNAAGHSVSTTFTTHVVPPGTTQGVKDTQLTVLFAPVITSLSATRIPGTGNVIWTAAVSDQGPASALSYAWGFVPDGTFSPVPTFSGDTNPSTMLNYTVQAQGTLTLAVTNGDGGTTTLSYLLPAGQFPDDVVQTGAPTSPNSIRAGGRHTCATLNNGQVYCWGYGAYGQLGYGNTSNIGDNEQPWAAGPVPVLGNVVQLAAGGNHTCALLDTGLIRCWGLNDHGQLGYGTTQNVGDDEAISSFGYVNLGGSAVKLAAGLKHTCALMDTGSVRCWGWNAYGQLGYGNTDDVGDDEQPWVAGDVQVGGAVQDLAAGGFHTCALLASGSVRCWGRGDSGQLGYGNGNNVGQSDLPADAGDVNVGGPVVQLSAGSEHTCALLGTSNIRCWGRGDSGQLGYGSGSNVLTPASAGDVNVGEPVVQLATGDVHTCVLTSTGGIRCWGAGGSGRLGYGNTSTLYAPPAATVDLGGATAFQVSAAGAHTCALLSTGRARCWGWNAYGQLGYGNTDDLGDDERPSAAGDINLQVQVDGANPSCSDATGRPFCTIQAAIDAAADGDTLSVAAGTYPGPLNIAGRSGLSIIGGSRDTVILRPTSTLAWNVASYGSSRQTPVRVVGSRDILFSNLTFDFSAVRADYTYGVLYWDSTGAMEGDAFENMSLPDSEGFYDEYTIYLRAPDFTDTARATVAIRDSAFLDAGRVGVLAHGFVEATIQGNTFGKSGPDFGYAIELGSQATGTISGNTISGYDTTAAIDGSLSAGILIDNAFTVGSPPLAKPVVISGNTVQGNEYGVVLGNDSPGLSGAIGIQVTLRDNAVLDNTQGGVYVTDSGRSSGSSVSVTAQGNRLLRNGPFGYDFATDGDGELHGTLISETISGQAQGIALEDSTGSSSGSLYDVAVHFSRISGNSVSGLSNGTSGAVDATNDWWGCNTGPGTSGCDPIQGNATAAPWLVLGLSMSPGTLATGDSASAVASLCLNSDGVDTSAAGSLPDGTPIAFSATLGSVSPVVGTSTGKNQTTVASPVVVGTSTGKAQATFTARGSPGTARVSAQLDNQTASANVTIIGD